MTEFRYTALDAAGKEIGGAIQAEDRSTALARIKGMGMIPLGLELGGGGAAAGAVPVAASTGELSANPTARKSSLFGNRVSTADLALFTRQLASLFNAGLNMVRCLDTLVEHCESPALYRSLAQVRQAVQAGAALWEAMSEQPRIYNELYVNLVRAGEASGQLGAVLERLADTMEQQEENRSRIRAAMAYPIMLITAGMGAVIFILVFLVPRFAKIFKSLNKPLPTPTLILLSVQNFVSTNGIWVLLGGIGIYVALKAWGKSETGGLVLDRARMKIPMVGSLVHKEAIARFCRTMATLVKGGVPILSSFEVAERAVGNQVLRLAIDQVRNAVRGGESLAPPLRATGVFPGLVTNMIAVGEETGNLDEMLVRVADAYDAEVSNRMRQMISMVEPAVILIMGAIIGTIVLSMLIPVLELSTGM
jgi:type II secretory pathway component PulF